MPQTQSKLDFGTFSAKITSLRMQWRGTRTTLIRSSWDITTNEHESTILKRLTPTKLMMQSFDESITLDLRKKQGTNETFHRNLIKKFGERKLYLKVCQSLSSRMFRRYPWNRLLIRSRKIIDKLMIFIWLGLERTNEKWALRKF